MASKALVWDQIGEREYETGVSKTVLYPYNTTSKTYGTGVAWSGVTAINESPDGAEPTDMYADDIKYLSLMSAEIFKGTIEAYTYPKEFEECDGSAEIMDGVTVGQQNRKAFGLCYRTAVGNDTEGADHGYKIHLIYGGKASPASKDYSSVNDSPEASTFSWEINTTPLPAFTVNGKNFKATATLTINTTRLTESQKPHLAALETYLYGGENTDPQLPTPVEVFNLLSTGKASGEAA